MVQEMVFLELELFFWGGGSHKGYVTLFKTLGHPNDKSFMTSILA